MSDFVREEDWTIVRDEHGKFVYSDVHPNRPPMTAETARSEDVFTVTRGELRRLADYIVREDRRIQAELREQRNLEIEAEFDRWAKEEILKAEAQRGE